MDENISAAGKLEVGAQDAPPIPRPTSLVGGVYETIFSRLMALKIAPGSKITVDNLARELRVSHTPIREALGRLESEGLVVQTHLIGYRAAPQIERRQFEELYELRLLLEPDAAQRATTRLDASSLEDLTRAAGVMSRRAGSGDERARYSQFAREDAAFHDMILKVGGNELIRETLARQHVHFHIFRLMFHSRVTEEALSEHEAIIAAFEARNSAGAASAMRNHLGRSRDRLLPVFE